MSALLSVAEEASRDQPGLAWDTLGTASTVAYQAGTSASREAVGRALDLLECQSSPAPDQPTSIDVNALRLWIRASTDPIGNRDQLLPYLHKIIGSPIEDPALLRIATAAWILDESDLAVRLLQDVMQRLQAPGVRGTSGGILTVLGWAYIDTGRWDEALDVAADAASEAEANQMNVVAASADAITATVLALRADSAAACSQTARALAAVDPAEAGLVAARSRRALGVSALADGDYLQAFTQLLRLFSDDGMPSHNYASYLGIADLAAAAVRADRRSEGRDVIEHALSHLNGLASDRLEQLIAPPFRGDRGDPGLGTRREVVWPTRSGCLGALARRQRRKRQYRQKRAISMLDLHPRSAANAQPIGASLNSAIPRTYAGRKRGRCHRLSKREHLRYPVGTASPKLTSERVHRGCFGPPLCGMTA